jgi:O-glycosyl hydrolase
MRNFFQQVGHFTNGVPGWGGGVTQPSVKTMNGESANNTNINDQAMTNTTSRDAIDLLGRHLYGDQLSNYANKNGKEMWMTEYNFNSGSDASYPNDSTWNYVWRFMNTVDFSLRRNNENAFIWWSAKRFYSLIGDGDFGTTDGAVLPRGYGLSHFAKFAKETDRVAVTASGNNGSGSSLTINNEPTNVSNNNFTTNVQDDRVVKVTAYASPDGKSISLVMFTPTATSGNNGVNAGTLKIQLPAGFVATSATAMRSTSSAKAVTEAVTLSGDGNSAVVTLPASNILSVKIPKYKTFLRGCLSGRPRVFLFKAGF